MGSKEILTLQFGHYTNFVGTHWWNIQEASFDYNNASSEINHDVLFREGLSPKGDVTFTPRLLLVDFQGSLKSLPESSELYETVLDPNKIKSDANWEANLVKIDEKAKEEKNKFLKHLDSGQSSRAFIKNYNFDRDVTVWSDFLYTRFHPRSINLLKQYQYNNFDTPFNVYPVGSNLWKTLQFQEDFADKIRNYIEECDSFQGFHLLFDTTNAFSGLSTSCAEYLRDEYATKQLLAFPIIPAHFPDNNPQNDKENLQSVINDSIRTINLALTFNNLAHNSSIFVPLSVGSKGWRQPGPKREFHHTIFNHELPYHSSAILASALDTLTLNYRLKSSCYHLIDLSRDLSSNGRKAAAASLCLPFSINKNQDFIDCLNNWDGPLYKSITPSCEIGDKNMMQLITIRGIKESRLKQPLLEAGKQKDMPAYNCNNIKEMLSFYINCNNYATATNVAVVNKALPVVTPFPNIFDPMINESGNVDSFTKQNCNVQSIPVLSGIHNGTFVGDMVESLNNEMKKIKLKRFHQFFNEGIDEEDLKECLDQMRDFRECYIDDNYLL